MTYEEIIRELLEDPDTVAYWPEVRTPEFFEAYIRHCKDSINSNPLLGLPKIQIGMRIVTSSCQNARLWGLEAFGKRVLGEPRTASALLDVAFSIAGSCKNCHAFLLWRRAKVHTALGQITQALADADATIELYRELQTIPDDHDIDGNGLANAYLARGDIRLLVGRRTGNGLLISQAVEDFSTALSLADPREFPVIFRFSVFALAAALAETGKEEDLLLANSHLRQARMLFRGPRKEVSQERARLDWVTGMVRYELGKYRLSRIREMLERALSDFLTLHFYTEASAVVSDLSKIHYPEPGPIRELTDSVLPEVRRYRTGLVGKIQALNVAANRDITSLSGGKWTLKAVQQALKEAIEDLREACGGKGVVPCILRWREVRAH